jgi:hypothetical protein
LFQLLNHLVTFSYTCTYTLLMLPAI